MIIRRILLNNAGPFLSEWEVELPEGVTAVVADYDDAPSRSNRAGKSFLAVDAPRYALFGEFRGRTDEFVHRLARSEEGGFVELEVESSEGTGYVLRRGRDKNGEPIRRLDGSQVSERDLSRIVRDEILGLSSDEYLLTNAFVQGGMHAFMQMTAGEKRRVVSPWFKTDRWVPRAELARKRLARAQSGLRALDDLEARWTEKLEGADDVEESVATADEAVRAAKADLSAAMEERAAAKVELEAAAGKRGKYDAARREVDRLERELEEDRARATTDLITAEREIERTKGEFAAATGRKDRIASLEREAAALGDLRATVDDTRSALRTAKEGREAAERARLELLAKFKEIEASRTGTCPVLREACDRIDPDPEVLETIRREGLARKREIERLGSRLDELGWKLDMSKGDLAGGEESVRELEDLRGAVTVSQAQHSYEAAKRTLEKAEAAASNAKLGKTGAGKALSRARRALGKLEAGPDASVERRVADAVGAVEDAERVLSSAELEANYARAALSEVETARTELEEIGGRRATLRTEVENLAWTSYAFGATGIPSRELENAFGVAEDAMNRVLGEIDTPLRLRFSPTRELKDWEPGCLACGAVYPKGARKHVCAECGVRRRKRRRDELRLEVLDGEHESTFDLDSGGGKILLSVGARLGLSSIPGSTRRVRCEHLLLDEPDGALDLPNRRALYALLRNRLPDLGIRQAIFITHTDVREQFDSVVTVRRWADEDRSGAWNE
jgi:DNA repair exonuclease SbcCD ATPase subunit